MANKVLELKSPYSTFLSNETRKALAEGAELSETSQEELKRCKDFFGVEDVSAVGTFTLSIENMLWKLFESLKIPESPIRLKAHERFLGRMAEELKKTLETDELPNLAAEDLKVIFPLVEDPEQFSKITFLFEYKNGDIYRTLPLPSVNTLGNDEFLTAIETVFASIA